jgi:hypothetical protein
MTNWVHLNFFPEPFTKLNLEIKHHPVLVELLAAHPPNEWEIRLAQIAQYCEVILDGQYMPEDVEKLCTILFNKLILKREDNRGILVIDSSSSNLKH